MREMKDSGIEWIGDIPVNWSIMPNKYLMWKKKRICPIYNGEDIISLSMNGVVIRDLEAGGKMPTTFDGYQYIESGNLLMCLFDIDVTPRCIGLIKNNGLTSPAYSQFVLTNIANAEYYNYYYTMLDNEKTLVHLAKNLRHSLTEEQLGMINTIVPPLPEQKSIADFLDSKCSEIDGLISDIQKQITTLEEYKRSVITESVTKGLNPDAEMKDSGVEWIGVIPKHWKIEKIKYHLKRNEPRNPGNKQVLSVYREYGVIPKDSRDDNHNVTSDDTSKYKYVVKNNLVINKMKAWQGSMGVSDYEGIVSPAYFIYIFTSLKLLPKYIHYLFRSSYKDEFRRISGGIREGQWDLSADEFENTVLLIPTISEQHKIIDYIQSKTNKIDSIISEKKKQIETIEEYKKSLIFEYVTGKKEVYVNE